MRLIGTLSNENHARKIVSYLLSQGMESRIDAAFDVQSGHMTYHLWVLDEDRITEAANVFEQFQSDSSNPLFDVPIATPPAPPPESFGTDSEETEPVQQVRAVKTPLTTFLIALCISIFFWNYLEIVPQKQAGLPEALVMTPTEVGCLYDVPPPIEEVFQLVQKRLAGPEGERKNLKAEVTSILAASEKMPYWRGIYSWILRKIEGNDPSLALGPMFSRISQGELWRLFSPCIMHSLWLHVLLNMIWLWILGRPVEQRIGVFRTALLTLALGVSSNTLQYLVAGPLFIGYSGVIMGLAGFIWMRQKLSPWEGYPLSRTTAIFLLLFIGSMFFLTLASLVSQSLGGISFDPSVANTAHIGGAIIGILLGRLPFFARRPGR